MSVLKESFKEKYEANLKLPVGWGAGGWIFSGTTHYPSHTRVHNVTFFQNNFQTYNSDIDEKLFHRHYFRSVAFGLLSLPANHNFNLDYQSIVVQFTYPIETLALDENKTFVSC